MDDKNLKRYLSPLGAWALAFGCAVGWGAFIMPGTTFLPIAGPLGTVIGMVVGAVVMLVIGVNYHYMMNRHPDAGGTYSYAKHELGYDHGILSAWFLILVYFAIIWANATAIPLIARNLLGGIFKVGHIWQIAGFDVYWAEVALIIVSFLLAGAACRHGGRLVIGIQIATALILVLGVVTALVFALAQQGGDFFHLTPAFPPGKAVFGATLNIVVLAPWAFAGFESISQSTEEFRFSQRKAFVIMLFAVITGGFAYITLALLAASAVPAGYHDWFAYLSDLENLKGIEGLPVFHAAIVYIGKPGVMILVVTILSGIITGLVGNIIAASRLIYSMAKDELLPTWFSQLSGAGVPRNAILFIVLLSLPIPFFGRTAIGWIVDVNTIGATIAYFYTSAVALKAAIGEKNGRMTAFGAVGAVISRLFFLYFMVPNFWTVGGMSAESYLILIAWSILGFVFFRYIFQKDMHRRVGKSTVLWMTMLFLIFFTSMLWLRQATHAATDRVLSRLNAYNVEELADHGVTLSAEEKNEAETFLRNQMGWLSGTLTRDSLKQMALLMLTLFIMFKIYKSSMGRERQMEKQKVKAEQSSQAKSTFLSNMSHDIRTPMNAIVGYVGLVKKEPGLTSKATEYLQKIELSSQHLLTLINDILDMSRIESGKMELAPVPTNLMKLLDEVRDLFAMQMDMKQLNYVVEAESIENKMVLCDANRLNRVLLNLVSNAYKFTPEGGSVSVRLRQTGMADGKGSYEFSVKDTGMGMSPEFAAKVFEAYERERTAGNIQGTGLGMAITKSIVDLMGGTIDVKTEQGKGTEFTIHVDFELSDEPEEETSLDGEAKQAIDFSKIRLLLVEDNEINREIASLILEEAGFMLEEAENGKIALDKVSASQPGYYQLVLMDVQMPVMNGYEATKAIRALPDPKLASIPIIAMTANAFAEDVQAAKDAGMDGHVAKPVSMEKMKTTLTEILSAKGNR
ncbi:MAG: amino acid permease [Victivallales bacterium]|nr:amino acid permease [Victivallales bacterium]